VQVFRQLFDHLLAVAFGILRLDNDFTNVPIKQNQLAVDGNRRAQFLDSDLSAAAPSRGQAHSVQILDRSAAADIGCDQAAAVEAHGAVEDESAPHPAQVGSHPQAQQRLGMHVPFDRAQVLGIQGDPAG